MGDAVGLVQAIADLPLQWPERPASKLYNRAISYIANVERAFFVYRYASRAIYRVRNRLKRIALTRPIFRDGVLIQIRYVEDPV